MKTNLAHDLEKSAKSIFSNNENPLFKALRTARPEICNAYVLNWIPEQGEDIYEILVDEETILTIEIDRMSFEGVLIKSISTKEFISTNKSKEKRRKLTAALQLISGKI